MPERFYLNDPLESQTVLLKDMEFHHLAHVLRIRLGEEIELVNGQGILARARVEQLERANAHLTLLKYTQHPRPIPSLLLGLSILRMSKLEWVIEKGTELGADAFFLFPADYSEKEGFSSHQLERLRYLTIAALKQCNRLYLPEIRLLPSLQEALISDGTILFGDTAPNAPKLIQVSAVRILFFTGPEKGFSPHETALLKQHGQGVRLHTNILRAETAPLVALSLLQQ